MAVEGGHTTAGRKNEKKMTTFKQLQDKRPNNEK